MVLERSSQWQQAPLIILNPQISIKGLHARYVEPVRAACRHRRAA
jgi:hypothetical protein